MEKKINPKALIFSLLIVYVAAFAGVLNWMIAF
jgi:hypothetical protein